MNPFEGVMVPVISNGQIMKLYDDNRYTRQRYIEAVTGSTFVIRIMFTNQFKLHDLKPDDGVAPWLDIDGVVYHRAKYISRNELDTKFLKAETGITEFSNVPHFCEEIRQWMESKFVFSSLQLKELADKNFNVAQAKDLGGTRITVQRCRFEKYLIPKARTMEPLKAITKVPEKALKGRAIANTVGYGRFES